MRSFFFATGALVLAHEAARAENWFPLDALSQAGEPAIEVDTDTLRQTAAGREVVVRVSYPQARVHRTGAAFRSVVAMMELRCDGGPGAYRDATFYADAGGRGTAVAREERSSPVPEAARDLLSARGLEQITKAACTQPTPATR